jgi:hypothetical protein
MSSNREYKNSLFTYVFKEPDTMLEIYNALTGSTLPPDTPIEPATLEDALYLDRINDLAFVVDGKLVVLIEHQSTPNKNMPLRLLIYMARVYERILDNRNMYRSKLIKIPKPEFYVLYIGENEFEDSVTLRLSDAFMDMPDAAGHLGATKFPSFLELEVPVININQGHNIDIIQKSTNLSGYTTFVSKVRELTKTLPDRTEAITEAVKYCLDNGILVNILSKISSEVVNMLMTEFNIEDAKKIWREEAYEDGIEKGKTEGISQMVRLLKEAGAMSFEEISKLSGLSVSDIENL